MTQKAFATVLRNIQLKSDEIATSYQSFDRLLPRHKTASTERSLCSVIESTTCWRLPRSPSPRCGSKCKLKLRTLNCILTSQSPGKIVQNVLFPFLFVATDLKSPKYSGEMTGGLLIVRTPTTADYESTWVVTKKGRQGTAKKRRDFKSNVRGYDIFMHFFTCSGVCAFHLNKLCL